MLRAWLDLRTLLLAALLALAAALPSVTTSVDRRDYYFFDLTLTGTSAGSTQFFWDYGDGFSEYNSSRQPIRIEPQPVVYRFMMPMGRFKALRFDPVDGAGVFTLAHAQIVDRRGRIVKVFTPEDILPGANIRQLTRQGGVVTVATDPASNDPVLTLRLDEPLELHSGPAIWWELGWPVAWRVFLVGLLLGLPPVARRLRSGGEALLAAAARAPLCAVAIAAAAAVAWQCHPVLFQGRSFASPNNGGHMLYQELPALPGDTDPMSANTGSSDTGALLFQHLYYPMVQRDALRAGELPLWNRYSLCGEPLLGQGQSMFGDPLNFLTIAADGAAWAWDVRFVLAHWIFAAALGAAVWRLTRGLAAALLTATGAAFLGFYTYRLCHPANFSVCYSPTILLAWIGLIGADRPRRQVLWLAALVGANWLVLTSGTVKEAYMLLVGLNFAGALLLWQLPDAAGRRPRVLLHAAAAGAGFILLSAPGWVSFLVAWKHAMTGYDTPQAHPLPWPHFIGFFDDIFYRQTQKTEDVVAPALNFLFLTGALWWAVQPSRWLRAGAGRALVLAAVPPFALGFGLVPLPVILKIPFVANIVHIGNTFSCVLLSLVTLFAGLGLHDAAVRLRAAEGRALIRRVWFAGLVLALGYFATTRQFPKSPFFTGYAASLALAAALLPLGVRWGLTRGDRPGPLFVALVLGLPLLTWRHTQFRHTDFERYTFVPGPRSDLHARSPAEELVDRNRKEPGRIVGFDSTLYASYNTVLRWEGMYGVDAVRSRHFHELADALGLQRVWNWDWPNREADSPALVRKYDLYNVTHYVATHRDGPHPITGVTPLGQADLDVYASPTAWPRAFFTDRVIGYGTANDFARLVMEGDGRPFAAVQAGDKDTPPATAGLADRAIHAARSYRLGPNSTTFTVEASGPGVAVLAETYYQNDFQVTVNGRPAPYFRVNHTFKGVVLPAAGTYEIVFRYWPEHLTAALWASAFGALFLAGGAAWLWTRRAPVPMVSGSPA